MNPEYAEGPHTGPWDHDRDAAANAVIMKQFRASEPHFGLKISHDNRTGFRKSESSLRVFVYPDSGMTH
jgi:hypothetical protein